MFFMLFTREMFTTMVLDMTFLSIAEISAFSYSLQFCYRFTYTRCCWVRASIFLIISSFCNCSSVNNDNPNWSSWKYKKIDLWWRPWQQLSKGWTISYQFHGTSSSMLQREYVYLESIRTPEQGTRSSNNSSCTGVPVFHASKTRSYRCEMAQITL